MCKKCKRIIQNDFAMKKMDTYNANKPSKQDRHETHSYDIYLVLRTDTC